MNKNSPKHTLSVVGFVFSVISVLFAILMLSLVSDTYYSENQASGFMGVALYTALPGIICSSIARFKKNTEFFSIIGIIAGIISIVIVVITIAGAA